MQGHAANVAGRFVPKGSMEVRPKGLDAVVYAWTDELGRFHALGYSGKRGKPDFRYYFRTAAKREEYVKGYFDKIKSHADWKADRATKRRESAANGRGMPVGMILHYSWGYDQTNCEFWQVTEVKGKSVVIRRIAAKGIPNSGGFMCQNVTAVKDEFLPDDHPDLPRTLTKRVLHRDDGMPYVSMKFGTADEWDGHPMYSSWYA